LVRQVLDLPPKEADPWRANQLVWPVLEILPELLEQPAALPLKRWLDGREGGRQPQALSRDRWQLAR
jgi:exodeoxyribonuclease V gamma subunit